MMLSDVKPPGIRWGLPLLYASQLVGWPLVAWIQVDSNSSQIAFRLVILAISAWVILAALRRRVESVDTTYLIVFIMIWCALLARLASDTLIDANGWRPGIEKLYFFALISCFIPSLAFLVPLDRSNLHKALYGIYALALIAALMILLQWGGTGPTSGMQTRLRAARLGPIDTGNLGATIVILSTYLIFHRNTRSTTMFIASCALAGGLFIIGAAASRSPVITMCVGVVLASSSVFRARNAVIVAIFLGILVVAVIFGAQYIENELGFGIISRSQGTKYDFHRVELWKNAWIQIIEHPLLGSNTSSNAGMGQYPHNLILECLMSIGILGGVLIMTIIGLSLRSALWLIFKSPDGGWVGLLYIQQLIVIQVSGTVLMAPEFWALSSGVVAIAYSLRRSVRTTAVMVRPAPPLQLTKEMAMHS